MTEPISPETIVDDDEPTPEPTPAPTEDDEAAEHEEAEHEQPPEEAPPEAQATTPEQWEKRFKSAERAFATYTRKVSDLWEDDAVHLTPFSISPSAPPGFLDVRDAGRVDEETKAAALQFLGFAREQDYEADPDTRTCGTCQGKGKTKTGSTVAGNETRTCRTCNGYGYVPPPDESRNGSGASADFHAPAGEHATPLVDSERDMWGEARVLPDGRPNPNYGKLPQHKVAVEPWGITANLTVQDAVV